MVDILIDIIPFTLILFIEIHIFVVFFVLISIQLRNFLNPIGLAYFFNNFKENEQNQAWGVLGTFNALFSLPFPLLIALIFELNPIYLFILSIIIIISIFVFAYLLLPSNK